MKNWYKLLSLALVFVMCFSLAACSIPGGTAGNLTDGTGNTHSDTKNQGVNAGNQNDGFILTDRVQYSATADNVSMESSSDSFTLSEKTYSAEEKFVYTATVSFENGVA